MPSIAPRRTPARHVAGYARPGELRCTHTAVVRFLHRLARGSALQPKKLTRCCGVRITPGLPSWLVGVVGPRARGYREVDNPVSGFPWIYKLAFMYGDRGDPHVTRLVFVAVADEKRIRFPNADSVLRTLALRAIRGAG